MTPPLKPKDYGVIESKLTSALSDVEAIRHIDGKKLWDGINGSTADAQKLLEELKAPDFFKTMIRSTSPKQKLGLFIAPVILAKMKTDGEIAPAYDFTPDKTRELMGCLFFENELPADPDDRKVFYKIQQYFNRLHQIGWHFEDAPDGKRVKDLEGELAAEREARGEADRNHEATVAAMGDEISTLSDEKETTERERDAERERANAEKTRADDAEAAKTKADRIHEEATRAMVEEITTLGDQKEETERQRDAEKLRADDAEAARDEQTRRADTAEHDAEWGRTQVADLSSKIIALQGEKTALETDRDGQKARAENAESDLEKEKKHTTQLLEDLSREAERANTAEADRDAERARADTEKARADGAVDDLTALHSHATEVERDRDAQRTRAETAEGRFASLEKRTEKLGEENDKLREELKEIDTLREQLRVSEERRKELETANGEKERQLEAKDTTISNLEAQLAEANRLKDRAIAEFGKKDSEIDRLEADIRRLQALLLEGGKGSTDTSDPDKARIAALDAELRDKIKELAEEKKRSADRIHEITEAAAAEKRGLTEELRKAQAANKTLTARNGELAKEAARIPDLERQIAELTEKAKVAEDEKNRIHKELEDIRTEKTATDEKNQKEIARLTEELRRKTAEADEFFARIGRLTREHSAAMRSADEARRAEVEGVNRKFEGQLAEKEKAREALEKENGRLNTELAGIKEKLTAAEDQLRAAQEEMRAQRERITELELRPDLSKELAGAKAANAALHVTLESQKAEIARLKKVEGDLARAQTENERLLARLSDAVIARDDAEKDAKAAKEALSTEKGISSDLRRQLDLAADENGRLKREHERNLAEKLGEKDRTIEGLRKDLDAKDATITDLRDRISGLSGDIAKLNDQKTAAERRISELEDEIRKLRDAATEGADEKAKARIKELEDRVAELERENRELDDALTLAVKQKATAEGEVRRLEDALSLSVRDNARLTGENEKLKKRIGGLEEDVKTATDWAESANKLSRQYEGERNLAVGEVFRLGDEAIQKDKELKALQQQLDDVIAWADAIIAILKDKKDPEAEKLRTDLEKVRADAERLQRLKDEANENLEIYMELYGRQNRTIEELRAEIAELKAKKPEELAASSPEDMRILQEELVRTQGVLGRKLAQAEADRDALLARGKAFKDRLAGAHTELTNLQSRTDSIENRLRDLIAQYERTGKDVKGLKALLKEANAGERRAQKRTEKAQEEVARADERTLRARAGEARAEKRTAAAETQARESDQRYQELSDWLSTIAAGIDSAKEKSSDAEVARLTAELESVSAELAAEKSANPGTEHARSKDRLVKWVKELQAELEKLQKEKFLTEAKKEIRQRLTGLPQELLDRACEQALTEGKKMYFGRTPDWTKDEEKQAFVEHILSKLPHYVPIDNQS